MKKGEEQEEGFTFSDNKTFYKTKVNLGELAQWHTNSRLDSGTNTEVNQLTKMFEQMRAQMKSMMNMDEADMEKMAKGQKPMPMPSMKVKKGRGKNKGRFRI